MFTGHHIQAAGVAYHGEWVTEKRNLHGHNWVLSMDKKSDYRSNGRSRTVRSCTMEELCTPKPISINWSPFDWQFSFWMVAEALVYDTELSKEQIRTVEQWINAKYGIVADIR